MLDSLLSFLDSQRDAVIDLQRQLTAIPALGPDNGGPGEREKADRLKILLAAMGLPAPREINAPDPRVPCGHRPNLAVIMPGADTSRTLWIISHLDIVPPGDAALWRTDPYVLTVEDDLLYGRGVEDNQQAVVSSVLLAKALAAGHITPPINYGMPFLTHIQETLNELVFLSEHDPLTKLYNRIAFERILSAELTRASRVGQSLALVQFEIDGFQAINAAYGHSCGDRILESIGELLLSEKRTYDYAARIGNNAFSLLLPSVGLVRAEMISERVLEAARSLDIVCDSPDTPHHITLSAGLACTKGKIATTSEKLHDAGLYTPANVPCLFRSDVTAALLAATRRYADNSFIERKRLW